METREGEKHALKADVMTAVDAPGKAGDLLLFSCYTAHHSFANRSDAGRRVILYTYNPISDGDTYDTYKGAHGVRCREWLAEHGGDAASNPAPTAIAGGVPQRTEGYSDDDPRINRRPSAAGAAGRACPLATMPATPFCPRRRRTKHARRLGAIASHVNASNNNTAAQVGDGDGAVEEKMDEVFGSLPLIPWEVIMKHSEQRARFPACACRLLQSVCADERYRPQTLRTIFGLSCLAACGR